MPLSNLDVARYVKRAPPSLTRQAIIDYFIAEGHETSEVLTALESAIQEGLIGKTFAESSDSFPAEDDSAEVWKGGRLVNEQRGYPVPEPDVNANIGKALSGADFSRDYSQVGKPRCPTCKSVDGVEKVHKMGVGGYLTLGIFALAADAYSGIGKTFVCTSCGYKW